MGGAPQGEGLMQPGGPRVHSEAQAAEERRDRRGQGDLKAAPRPGSALLPLLAAKLLAAGFGKQWATYR